MPRVSYVDAFDAAVRHEVDAAVGTTVMRAAVGAGVEGIIGECGGNAMCASCHVYVDEEWTEKLPEIGEIEEEMLEDTASPRRAVSRLSCQITLTAEMDGLVVNLPEEQL